MVGAGHATKADTLNRGFLIEHSANGKHKFSDGAGMLDNSGNEIAIYNVVGSAVNYLELGNAAVNGTVTIQGLGDDSNVNVSLTGKGTGVVRSTLAGYAARRTGCILYSDTDTVTINGNCIEVDGKLCWWDADIAFDLGSAGSNAASTNLGANEIHFIYIDHSTVTSGTELTAANFVNNKTATGSKSTSKYGYYNGSDRCIGVILTDGSNQILLFNWVNSGDYYYDVPIIELDNGAAGSYTDVDCSSSIPNFGNVTGYFSISNKDCGSATTRYGKVFFRSNGSSDTSVFIGSYKETANGAITTETSGHQISIVTDTSQIIEYNHPDYTSGAEVDIYVRGFNLNI